MKLKSLYLSTDYNEIISGSITFSGSKGEVSLKLTPDHCQSILAICADALVDQAKEAAADLTAAVHEAASGKALEDKSADELFQ